MKQDGYESDHALYARQVRSTFGWLCFLVFFSTLNETVFNVSLPDIAKQFGIAPSVANWVNTSFILSFGVGSLIFSRIADIYSVKKLLIIGLLIYSGGSLMGMIAQSYFPAVAAARMIQGAGASAVPGLIMVIITRYVDKQNRGKAFGLVGSVVALSEGIGPAIGGIVADYIHWSFLFLLPVMTLFTIPFWVKVLPNETKQEGKTDFIGAILLSVGIVTMTLYMTQHQWMYLLIGLLFSILFLMHIRRAEQPFLSPSLLRNRRFIFGVLTGALMLGIVAGFISMVPYMMRDVHALTTGMIGGRILFPGTISVILFGVIGGVLVDKRGVTVVWYLGFMAIAASFVTITLFLDRTPWFMPVVLIFIFGGLSFVKTVISTVVSASLDAEQAGAGMGLLNLVCFLAEGIGIAVVGSLLTEHVVAFPWLLSLQSAKASLYSNVLLILVIFTVISGLAFAWNFKRK
nr:MFS transporter [Paenibacillus selenitireducens]